MNGDTGRRLRALALVGLLTGSLFPPVLGVSLVVVAAAVVVPLLTWEAVRRLPVVPVALVFALGLTALLVTPGLLNPPFTPYGQEKFASLWQLTALSMAAVGLLRDREDVHTFARCWLGAGLLLAAVSVIGTNDAARATGFGSNPIWLARAIAVALIVLVWLFWERRISLPWAVVLGAALGWGILATGSRGPLAGAVLGVTLLAVSAKHLRGRRLLTLLAAGAAGVGAILYLPSALGDRFTEAIVNPAGEVASTARGQLWSRTLDVIADHPGGVGLGNWTWVAHGQPFRWPHNLFLEVLAESGWIVGGALILVVLAVFVRVARLARHDSTAALVLALLAAETVAVSVSGDLNARTFFALLTLAAIVPGWAARPSSAGIPTSGLALTSGRLSERR